MNSDMPEFAVRRDTFNQFFSAPLATSTFHDLVNKGKIIPVDGIRGFYLLNQSLRRIGLKEVSMLPVERSTPSMEDIIRLAFHLIDEELFPAPSWLLHVETISIKDTDHARSFRDRHWEGVASLGDISAKLNYFQGVLDWASMEKEFKD